MLTEDLIKKIRKIHFQARFLAQDAMLGEYRSVFRGQGMEFNEVRPYVLGDDVRLIDWNIFARQNELVVKEYREEREVSVYIALDLSASLNFASTHESKRHVAAELSAVLAWLAVQNNDNVGLLLFTNSVERFIPPRRGRNHIFTLIREILTFVPASKQTNFEQVARFLLRMAHRRSIVFWVSDFLSFKEHENVLTQVARRHEVIAFVLRDAWEKSLPDFGVFDLCDAETGEIFTLDFSDATMRQRYLEMVQNYDTSLQNFFDKRKIDYVWIAPQALWIDDIVNFFHKRMRRGVGNVSK